MVSGPSKISSQCEFWRGRDPPTLARVPNRSAMVHNNWKERNRERLVEAGRNNSARADQLLARIVKARKWAFKDSEGGGCIAYRHDNGGKLHGVWSKNKSIVYWHKRTQLVPENDYHLECQDHYLRLLTKEAEFEERKRYIRETCHETTIFGITRQEMLERVQAKYTWAKDNGMAELLFAMHEWAPLLRAKGCEVDVEPLPPLAVPAALKRPWD